MIIYGYRIFDRLGGNNCHSIGLDNDKRVLEIAISDRRVIQFDFVLVFMPHGGPIELFLVPASDYMTNMYVHDVI